MRPLVPFLFLPALAFAAPDQWAGESELKAAYIYNFALFVDWPLGAGDTGNAFRLCVHGKGPLAEALAGLEGKPVRNKRVEVRRVAPAGVGECHALVIAGVTPDTAAGVLGAVRGTGILTISDADGAVRSGAMIGLGIEQRRVVFEVNVNATQKANLAVSSKLLRLAKTVY